MVEHGSHRGTPTETTRPRMAGVLTASPLLGRVRSDGHDRAQISEHRRLTRPDVRTSQVPRSRRVKS